MDQRRIILLGALLLTMLAAAFYWYGESDIHAVNANNQALKRLAPEAIVQDFRQTVFNKLGIRQYRMEADTAIYYSLKSTAEMTSPTIAFFKKFDTDIIDWTATAHTGVVRDNGDTLVLSGAVNISKPLANRDTLTFNTESLLIRPNEEIAKTDEPVTITQSPHTTKANGLLIDIRAGKVKLLSQVRSQYVPATL
ncbi:MAG: LPS export ABC transporter periplasmic protein LptC [Gammaproteobacteria bacterium]|nr:MAG: LPS export ABC transporter periplasmic protein LptC [Gammaproteobacteria bacterium]